MKCKRCGERQVPEFRVRRHYYICNHCHQQRYGGSGARRKKLRLLLLERYGDGRCRYCGSQNDLQLDHVNGGGKLERQGDKNSTRLFRRLWAAGCPPGYQVLCKQCNFAKRDLTEDEFFAWIEKVHQHHEETGPQGPGWSVEQ